MSTMQKYRTVVANDLTTYCTEQFQFIVHVCRTVVDPLLLQRILHFRLFDEITEMDNFVIGGDLLSLMGFLTQFA